MKPKKSPVKAARMVVSHVKSLVLTDSSRVRSQWFKKLKAARKRLEKAQAILRNYNEKDHPEFERWYRKLFGKLMIVAERLNEQVFTYREFWETLRDETPRTMNTQETLVYLLEYADKKVKRNPDHRENGDWSPQVLLDCMRKLWIEPREKRERAAAGAMGADGVENDRADKAKDGGFELTDAQEQELKVLYRKMCRLLHPDAAGTMTPEMMDHWLKVQEANGKNDLHQMEELATAWDEKKSPAACKVSCAQLIEEIEDCRELQKSLEDQIVELKNQDDWDFAARNTSHRHTLSGWLRIHIETQIQDLKKQLRGDKKLFATSVENARDSMES